ncbi:putative disease resistance protein RGA3 [Ziziphus jujuba]|uniref:Disease resistance protein RGA3 n=1 Tax=Ziziphus jujuba TaxID=326968 RepID=A0ABM4A136_ZIZJJ|nr:putative disease resistance protein RGA3 [Ziziphus jujuba]
MEALNDGAGKKPVEDVLLQGKDKLKELLEDTISSRIKDIQGDPDKKKKVENRKVRRRVRTEDALYKADDLMDEVLSEAAKPDLNSKQLVSLAKKLRETIKDVVDAAAGDNVRPDEPHKFCFRRPRKVSTKELDPTVNRLNSDSWLDKHKKDIQEQLWKDITTNGEEHVAVVAIVGNGGLGKTTLALNLFQRLISQKDTDFDLRIWVNVPHEFNKGSLEEGIFPHELYMRSLVDGIIRYTTKKDVQDERLESRTKRLPQCTPSEGPSAFHEVNSLSVEQLHKEDSAALLETEISAIKDSLNYLEEGKLHDKLQNIINGKRLLLVLDDVLDMDTEKWLHFKNLLSNAVSDGSRIIITTCSKLVGDITASTDKNVHMLRHLDEHDPCDLFQRFAFDFQKPVNSKIVEVAVEIVKRCGGNPFALKIVGEKLKSTNLETQGWSNFRDNEFQKVVNEEILPFLQLSYNILSSELKQCFAYCGIFLQQSEIDVKNLIHLWMALGLIYPEQGQRMEDRGYAHVKELCQRSMFEELEVDHENSFVTKCKMPKLMHDLAVLALGTRLATFKQKEKLETGTDERSTQKDKSDVGVHGERTLQNKHDIDDETTQKDKCAIGIKVVLESNDKMKHLKYLDLSQNKGINLLPDSITKVPNLMTLKLSSCCGLKELPKDMEKLVNLKHLEIDWSNGESRVLTPTVPKCLYRKGNTLESLDELEELNNLRGELKIRNLRNVNVDYSKVTNLEGKQHLKSLTLAWEFDLNADDQAVKDKAQDTQQGLKLNSKLKELGLFGYRGDKLSDWLLSLTNLYISNKSGDHNSESNPSSSTEFIKKLEEVRFIELPNLERWWEERDASLAFPHLSRLMIEDCPKLCSMPLYPNLKEWLVLKNTSLVPFINTMKDESSVKRTLMNDGSSSTPLSNLQSLCITGDKDMGSEYN